MNIKHIVIPKQLKTALFLLFPIYTVLATELGHLQTPGAMIDFVTNHFGVFLFDIIIVGGIYFILSALMRKAWISASVCFVMFYTFSCVEFYKYKISGSHFVITDLALTKNVGDVASFASLSFNLLLLLIALLYVVYIAFMWLADIEMPFEKPVRYAASVGVFAVLAVFLVTPYFQVVCGAAGVNSEYTKNTFQENKRFSVNSLTANLTVNVNQLVNEGPVKPQDYTEEAVDAIIEQAGIEKDDPKAQNGANVIVVMSESFADFRTVLEKYPDSGETLPEGIYDAFDKILSESTEGVCVVPTFGGGTARTEAELIFGLPMETQGNPSIPLSLFEKGKEYRSIPGLFRDNGYSTTYIHPFSADFYERVDYYGNFGFDKLLFDEDMAVYLSEELVRLEKEEGIETYGYYHNFISDKSAFDEALARIEYTEGPDYIHITTMQNHMPYGEGEEEEKNYFTGIQNSCEALYEFVTNLKSIEEPVILLFLGDHFPFFSDAGSIYGRLGIDELSCDALYEQKYFIWNNYGAQVPQEPEISTFYLPCILSELAGVEDSFTRAVLSQKEICPIYSPVIATEGTEVLKILAYDRINGEGFAE